MLGSIFRRAEVTIDNAVNQALLRLAAAIPIAIGLGFAIAGIFTWSVARFGLLETYAFMALGFLAIGVAALAMLPRNHVADEPATEEASAATGSGQRSSSFFSSEVALDAATALGPALAPLFLRPLLRNLPLILVMAIIAYVLARIKLEQTTASPATVETV